jgi:hypothetical protein
MHFGVQFGFDSKDVIPPDEWSIKE